MFLNYLRMAVRQMRHNKLYSVINIFCLAAGITVTLTIVLYELHEYSYDRWHARSKRIFLMASGESFGSRTFFNQQLTIVAGPAAKEADASVQAMTRMYPVFQGVDLQNRAKPELRFRETREMYFVDSNFFSFFSFRLLRGNPATVLSRPFTVVVTESQATKYFGSEDPMGKTLLMDGRFPLEVTGVAADVPSNSSIHFGLLSAIGTMSGVEKFQDYLHDEVIQNGSFSTWLLLRDARDTAKVEPSLARIGQALEGRVKEPVEDGPFKQLHQYRLFPIKGQHLRFTGVHGRYLGPLMGVAGVILLLALVNYMSLATARAAVRAKEVGVRKILGAGRLTLAGQFYTESALFAVAAFVVGGVLFLWLKGYFYRLMGVRIDPGFLTDPVVLGFFSGLFVLIVLIAGSYPSLVLSHFRPVTVLYGKLSRKLGGERVRKGFIVLQFAISMTLVISSAVIGQQLYFIRHADTGIDRENVVMLPFAATMEHYDAYRHEVEALPAVKRVASSHFELYADGVFMHMVDQPGKNSPAQVDGVIVDSNFISMLGMKWAEAPLAGSHWTGKKNVLLNEAAVADLGLDKPAIGRQLRIDKETVTVAGVLKNFNYLSLHAPIKPFAVTVTEDAAKEWAQGIYGCLYVKIGAHANVPTVMGAIKKIYGRYDLHTPFRFDFLDEAFDNNYKQEDQLAGLMSVFTTITIVIACLGLFALATFAAEQRVKEIGIRKVLGASAGSICLLLSGGFLRPVLLAVVISCPVAAWVMHGWLADFAYRIPLSGWIFMMAAIGLMGVALATVMFRSLGAARANPVDNLRLP